jgi:manganese/zinc/iron transport system permease protein
MHTMIRPLLLFKLGDVFSYNQQMLLTLLILAVACAIVGCFLVLRNLSMVTDALSHTILLGIVLAYFVTKNLNSPLLFIGAGLFGIFTVYCIELLSGTGLVKNDDAVGIIFPLFFSLAVILISTFARDVHLDTDIVLMGQVIMIPLNTIDIFGIVIPKAMLYMLIMLIANTLFIAIFYKELKVSTFDPEFSGMIGFSSGFLFYALMSLTSFTAVSAFDAVGTMLSIALFVGPAASAYLLTKNLKQMLIVSILYASMNTIIGFYSALSMNVSISGMIATITGLSLILTSLFYREGVVTSVYLRHRRKKEFQMDLLIIHLGNHEYQSNAKDELGFESIQNHLNWDRKLSNRKLRKLSEQGYVQSDLSREMYLLTKKGKLRYDIIKTDYGM